MVKAERQHNDEVVKSSTDKLSTVVDWLVEQVPTAPVVKLKSLVDSDNSLPDGSPNNDASDMKRQMHREGTSRMEKDLKTRMDLERFYVALTRKMYDEGL